LFVKDAVSNVILFLIVSERLAGDQWKRFIELNATKAKECSSANVEHYPSSLRIADATPMVTSVMRG